MSKYTEVASNLGSDEVLINQNGVTKKTTLNKINSLFGVGSGGDTTIIVQQVASGTYISTGGSLAWVSGRTYRVGATVYLINGVEYTSLEAEVTLGEADAENPRIDVIALDSNGDLVVIAGTAAAEPALPDVDPTVYCMVTFVYLPAASNPDVTSMAIYEEGSEWTVTPSHASIVKDATTTPRTDTKCIDGTAVIPGKYFTAVKSGTFDISAQNNLIFYIHKKAAWPSTRTITLRWYRGGTAIGNAIVVVNGSYGFNSAAYGSYEQIVCPVKSFNVPAGTLADRLRVTLSGTGDAVGFFIDDISLQAGTVVTSNPGMSWAGTWSATVAYARNDVVLRNGGVYVCLEACVNLAPETYTTYWTAIVAAPDPPEVLIMLLDKDVAIATGDNIGNVQIPIPASMVGLNLSADSRMIISPLGTASASGALSFNIVRHRPTSSPVAVDATLTSPAFSIAQTEKISGAPSIDTSNDDLADGDFLSISCEGAGSGAKGPLWAKIVAE
jgi:hypothetical protein